MVAVQNQALPRSYLSEPTTLPKGCKKVSFAPKKTSNASESVPDSFGIGSNTDIRKKQTTVKNGPKIKDQIEISV